MLKSIKISRSGTERYEFGVALDRKLGPCRIRNVALEQLRHRRLEGAAAASEYKERTVVATRVLGG